jgi:hypothetical protein
VTVRRRARPVTRREHRCSLSIARPAQPESGAPRWPARTTALGRSPRFGVSAETICRWRKRGADARHHRSARLNEFVWCARAEERAIVCALHRPTGFPVDALTCVVSPFLPHLKRDVVCRLLKAGSLNWLPSAEKAHTPHGSIKD